MSVRSELYYFKEVFRSSDLPDPRICTTGVQIQVLLVSSVAFKMATKISFFLLLAAGTFTTIFENNKLVFGQKLQKSR